MKVRFKPKNYHKVLINLATKKLYLQIGYDIKNFYTPFRIKIEDHRIYHDGKNFRLWLFLFYLNYKY